MMDAFPQYWHWLLAGTCLVVAELFRQHLLLLWPGLAALAVGLAMMVFPSLPWPFQLLLFVLVGIAGFRERDRVRRARWFADGEEPGQYAAIGEAGTVIRVPGRGHRGRVEFVTPVQGREQWLFHCEQPVTKGDRVYIREIGSRELEVVKI